MIQLSDFDEFLDPEEDRIIAYGLAGSRIYGLEHEDSDLDMIAVIEGANFFDDHIILGDKDCRIMSFDSFTNRLKNSIPNEVDILRSGHLTIVDGSYTPYLSSVRPSVYEYIRRNYQQIGNTKFKRKKSVRTSIRCAMMNRRAIKAGEFTFPVRFTDSERDEFHAHVDRLQDELDNGMSQQDITSEILRIQNDND